MAAKRRARANAQQRPVRKAGAAARGVTFNHAMVYCRDVARSVAFYRDLLGFRVVDEYPGAYARLATPAGTTIALHCVERGRKFVPAHGGVRLYFEVRALDACCRELRARGVLFDQMPKDMPWGWRHAYLRDPDGHDLSLYRAGAARLRKTSMRGGGD